MARHIELMWILALAAACHHGQPPAPPPVHNSSSAPGVREGDWVLVTDANFGYPHAGRPGAIAFITDPREVEQLRHWLIGNDVPYAAACGYHWEVVFGGRDRVDGSVSINQECGVWARDTEKIRAHMRELGRQLVEKPDHFLYTLVIPTSIRQRDAIAQLRAAREIFFYVPDDDLPSASVAMKRSWPESPRPLSEEEGERDHMTKATALEAELTRHVAELAPKFGAKLVDVVKEVSWSSGPNGTTEIQDAADLRLAQGVDLERFRQAVTAFGGEVQETDAKDHHWVLVVSTEPTLARAKEVLLARYPFARDVIEQRGLPEGAVKSVSE